jgi:hypothetical protein
MRRYFSSHLPIALAYGLFVMAIRGNWWPFHVSELIRWILWLLGTAVGVGILFLDRVAYTYAYPGEQLSQQFSWLVKNKQYIRAIEALDSRRQEQERLTFRSVLFMALWVFLAFFALTSTSSLFGKGVVMGLMLHILYDAWRLQKADPSRLDTRLFWQIKRKFSNEEKLVFLWVITGIFGLFSFLVS